MKIIAVMPAYNAARTLEQTFRDIPPGVIDEIILVDDNSSDNTLEIAKQLGLITVIHSENRGYGANQKTCYRMALERGADIVVMIHPDYQYDSRLTGYLVNFIKDGYVDIRLGSRIRTRREALEGGMPFYKYVANRFLTMIENIISGQNLSEWHTGFRAYSRKVLETIPWQNNSDDFVFDSQFLFQCVAFGFKIGEIPVPVRYHEKSSSINFVRSAIYGFLTLKVALLFLFKKIKVSSPDLFKKESEENLQN
jgi:glycosyltransferase involved in cell wall biosynthesis